MQVNCLIAIYATSGLLIQAMCLLFYAGFWLCALLCYACCSPPKQVCFSVLSCISLEAKFGGFNVRFLMFYFIKAACIYLMLSMWFVFQISTL